MSTSAMEDGSRIWGKSFVSREVRGIGEFGSKGELSFSSPSSIFDSERTKDFLASG